MGEAGFEPAKAEPPDLQSGPFDHSGIPPWSYGPASYCAPDRTTESLVMSAGGHMTGHRIVGLRPCPVELAVGIEPTTSGLQNRSSTVELR